MISKSLDNISSDDIQALIDNAVPELRTIEYKRTLPGSADGDKKEFLADISSLANADGGDIVYGISDKKDEKGQNTGIPEDIVGLGEINVDAVQRQLEEVIRTGIEPRIQGVHIVPVVIPAKGTVIVVRVPRGWNAPHMVRYKGSSRFYSRTSAGKYQLDVVEIRDAFLRSSSLFEDIKSFRDERIGRLISQNAPATMASSRMIVFHIVPLESVRNSKLHDARSLSRSHQDIGPICCSGWGPRHNFDGILLLGAHARSEHCTSYVQIFRSGIVEACDTNIMNWQQDSGAIPSAWFEKELIKAWDEYKQIPSRLGIPPPYIVLLSLLGTKGCYVCPETSDFAGEGRKIDRNELVFPEVLVEDISLGGVEVMRPFFDLAWQASGYERSYNYDDNGKYGR